MGKVFIIAEAGVNHNGSVDIAKKMVDIAVEAGANAVKFQTFKAEKIVTLTASKARYQIENMGINGTQFEMLKNLELSKSDHKELKLYCDQNKIIFMSSPFDEESVDFLDELGMKIFKIPSGEITNKVLLGHIAIKKKPIMLSTGMSYLEEVKKAVGWINGIWQGLNEKPELVLLHCLSNYPAQAEDVNLMAMNTLRAAFGLPVGYSDHTLGIEISVAAVALGAEVIEKHFTLAKDMAGPDHKASLNPHELRAVIRAIRNTEKAIGDGVKRPAASEEEIKKLVRKSLVAARDIKAGEIIKRNDVEIKRPGTGIPPEYINQIVNRKLLVNIKKEMLFEQSHFGNIR